LNHAAAGSVQPGNLALVHPRFKGGRLVSIVRVGLGETKKYGDGYDAIFGKKKSGGSKKTKSSAAKAKKPTKVKKK
jgi:hypothetical protein